MPVVISSTLKFPAAPSKFRQSAEVETVTSPKVQPTQTSISKLFVTLPNKIRHAPTKATKSPDFDDETITGKADGMFVY